MERVRQLLTLATTPQEQRFYEEMIVKCPHVCQLQEPLTYEQYQQLRIRYPTLNVGEVMRAMENHVPLKKKYRSAYLTLNNWLKRE